MKVGLSFLIFFTAFTLVFHFMLDPDSNPVPVPVPLRQEVAVPVPQHCSHLSKVEHFER